MNEALWLPGLLVLAAGLASGFFAAYRLRSERSPEAAALPDLRLTVEDLLQRREQLYRRLRAAGDDGLTADEVRALETRAARTLRDLDQAVARLPKSDPLRRGATAGAAGSGKKGKKARPERPEEPAPPQPAPAASPVGGFRHPLLVGFLFGGAMVALVGILIYWAGRDAQPGRPGEPAPTTAGRPGEPPHEAAEIPPELAAGIADLEAVLAADPANVMALKELALMRLQARQFFQAFEDAGRLLGRDPEDPDGLFVQGVVRVTMGRNDEAIGLFDRVLAQYPDHLQALMYRGLAHLQSGRPEQAIDTWEFALDAAGGSHPDLEHLIRMARSQPPPEPAPAPAAEPQGSAAPAGGPATEPAAPSSPALEAVAPAVPAGVYRVRLELAAGAAPPPAAALFVFLRPEGGGPPSAVKRLDGARFPLEFELGSGDTMMGGELPASGVLVARLDADGNASTRDPGDLAAEAPARLGTAVTLVLSP